MGNGFPGAGPAQADVRFMDWYYAVGTERKGPVGEDEFLRLVREGAVTAASLVWHEGMANWQPHGELMAAPPPLSAVTCSGCGRSYGREEVILLEGSSYCAACKPAAVQRMKEGGAPNAAEQTRKTHLSHEASVQSIGVLYYLGGGFLILIGAMMAAMMSVAGVFLLLMGAGQIWVGTGLRRLKGWARIPTAVLSVIGLLAIPIGTLINAYILYLLFCRKGNTVFSEEYRRVIEQTPGIKYRTSIVM